ncbi:hypothetical protein P7C73_g4412, partial [Tremellales sp. Uapishka_1]
MSVMSSSRPEMLDPMHAYRAKRDRERRTVLKTYKILGFISSGTYGRVYKALLLAPTTAKPLLPSATRAALSLAQAEECDPEIGMRPGDLPAREGDVFAIKKFKPDKEGDVQAYAGISQSGAREIMLNRELHHRNLVALREVILEDKAIYMVFEYAEHDFLQIIHHHSQTLRTSIPMPTLKRLLHQLLCGLHYLHSSFVLHRDLKPANILVTSSGVVKIGDLGLARLWHKPLAQGGLFGGDKVVVTIWYRAPELILGAKHYTAAIGTATPLNVACHGELTTNRPLGNRMHLCGAALPPPDLQGRRSQARLEKDAPVPARPDGQDMRSPRAREAHSLHAGIQDLSPERAASFSCFLCPPLPADRFMPLLRRYPTPTPLPSWYSNKSPSQAGYNLMTKLFEWDPAKRLTAKEALAHPWFNEDGGVAASSVFEGSTISYPTRRVTHEDNGDSKMGSLPPTLAAGNLTNPRLPSSSNFRTSTGNPTQNAKRTKLR